MLKEYNGEQVYIGFAKEPLMPTENYGFLGVKIQNEKRTEIMCNECGKFFKRIHTKHLKKHGMDFLEYKQKYGYNKTTSLLADEEANALSKKILGKKHSIQFNKNALKKRTKKHKEALSEGRSSWKNTNDRQNKYGTCYEQVKDRLRAYITSYGRLPTYNAIGHDGRAIYSLLKHRYGDVNKGFEEYGLPTKKLSPGEKVVYTFKDGTQINIGYKYDNWDKLKEKILQTSYIFNGNKTNG